MYPESEDVFANSVEEHAKYLFPLFSIELEQINPSWTGRIHMLHSNEDPYNTSTAESFNDYCKDCMIGFDVIDGKYSFKSSFNYFDLSEDWQGYYEKTKLAYGIAKQQFHTTGQLSDRFGTIIESFRKIGGEPNWMQTDETPLDPEGNAMSFIVQASASDYIDDGSEKEMYLFYSDKYKLAIIIYQTT